MQTIPPPPELIEKTNIALDTWIEDARKTLAIINKKKAPKILRKLPWLGRVFGGVFSLLPLIVAGIGWSMWVITNAEAWLVACATIVTAVFSLVFVEIPDKYIYNIKPNWPMWQSQIDKSLNSLKASGLDHKSLEHTVVELLRLRDEYITGQQWGLFTDSLKKLNHIISVHEIKYQEHITEVAKQYAAASVAVESPSILREFNQGPIKPKRNRRERSA